MSSRSDLVSVFTRVSTALWVLRVLGRAGRGVGRIARRPSGRFGLAVMIGYLLGTFPTADLVGRRGGHNLRREGSGNPGGANAMKVMGTGAGLTVMGVDIAKGAAACAVGGALAGPTAAHVAGSAAVAGHCYPVWSGFRGGKGVAASVGQCAATFPAYFPIDAAVAGITAAVPAWKQRAFASTVVSSACWVAGGLVWWRKQWPNLWGPRPTAALPVAAAVSSAMIMQRFLAEGDPHAPLDAMEQTVPA